MKKALPVFIIIAAIAVWWFLPFGKNDRTGPVNTHLPDQIDTIVLISIDTIRADHMSCYGYEQRTTPNIDRIAKDSMFFQDAFSPIPLTLPAHSSMLSGLLPPTHGIHDNFEMRLPDEILTLPEIMKDNGFSTYGIISSVVLDDVFGMDQGFDVFDDAFVDQAAIITNAERKGNETTENTIKWLTDNRGKKKFMFIHYYDPHQPYSPPEPFSKQFEHPYDGEIAFTDHCIGKVLDKLKSLKLYEDALIVIVGDHGEMLGEHNEAAHSFFVYQSAIRVPLMFKLPRDASSVKITEPCSIIDIPPTILALAGIDIPEKMQGINLLTLAQNITGKPASSPESTIGKRALYSESFTPTKYNASSLLSVISGDWHYIQTTKPELYNRIKDPAETNNLIAGEAKRARVMQLQLKEILDASVVSTLDTSADIDNKTLQLLESLGYIGGSISTDFSFDVSKTNPTDVLDIHNTLLTATLLTFNNNIDKAIPICQKLIKTHPDIPETYRKLASCYAELKSYQKQIETLHILLKLKPDDFRVLRLLAVAYDNADQIDLAIEYGKKALAQLPGDPGLTEHLAGLYTKQGSYALAIPLLLQKLSGKPEDFDTLRNLAVAYDKSHDYLNAVKYCESLLTLRPEDPAICSDLANFYMKSGSNNKAIKFYKQSLVLSPNNMNTLKGLTDAYEVAKDYEHAIETLQTIAKFEPQNALVYDRLAGIYAKQGSHALAIPLFLQKLSDKPDDINALNNLVAAYSLVHDFPNAAKYCESLFKLQPEDPAICSDLAKLYMKSGSYSKAIPVYKQSLVLSPNDLNSLMGLADAYKAVKDYEHAIEKLQTIAELEPQNALVYGRLADVYLEQKAYRKAAEVLKGRLKLTPKDIGSLGKLVDIYTKSKEYQLCIDSLKQLLEIIPDNIETNYQLAKNYHYLNKYPEAVQGCLRTLQLAPKHLKAHLCLSQTYLKMNRLKEAIAQYESALELKPDMLLSHTTVAWLQATQKNPELYDPKSALVHAQKAAELTLDKLTGKHTNPNVLDILAVAQAANGQFDAAAVTASLAIEISREKGLNSVAEKIQKRLDLYKQQKAYRQ